MITIDMGCSLPAIKADRALEISLACSTLAFLVALFMREHDLG